LAVSAVQGAMAQASVLRWFARGWNVGYSAWSGGAASTASVWNVGWAGLCRVRCWVLRVRECLRVWAGLVVGAPWGCLVAGDGSLFENCRVDASICGQVVKGARWMPWHQEPMKDVGGRDRPRGAVNRAVIRGCPNGGTRQSSWAVTRT
jgi:hypothetical protein